MARLLAHQGGWDEVLLFVVPILLAFLVIRALERKRPPVEEGSDPADHRSDSGSSAEPPANSG